VMNFELVLNEILIELFEYLNIFYSFDGLNYRFDQLIRNIPLVLNFQGVPRSVFEQFCMNMLSNPAIKTQIYSLKLSNNDTCGQIKGFLECFSLEEFSHLQSLTLTHVRKNNIDKLQAMLPLINELSCFRLFDSNVDILTEIPTPKLRKLTVPNLIPIDTISSITSLTLSKCPLHELYQIFYYAPMLTYLNVEDVSTSDHPTNNMTDHIQLFI
jgi:hypothetical protein